MARPVKYCKIGAALPLFHRARWPYPLLNFLHLVLQIKFLNAVCSPFGRLIYTRRSFSIKIHLIDVFPYLGWQKMTYLFLFSDGLPDKTGGDLYPGCADQGDRGVFQEFEHLRTTSITSFTWIGIDRISIQQLPEVFPLWQCVEIIFPHD